MGGLSSNNPSAAINPPFLVRAKFIARCNLVNFVYIIRRMPCYDLDRQVIKVIRYELLNDELYRVPVGIVEIEGFHIFRFLFGCFFWKAIYE